MTATAIKLLRFTVVSGRVKAPPFSVAARRLEFAVLDAKGTKIHTGMLDHPLWQETEAPDPNAPVGWQRIVHQRPEWVFQIRVPADLAAGTRVAFFEWLPHTGKPGTRRALDVVRLPARARAK